MDWDSYFVFNPKDSRSKIYVEVYDGIVSILNLETRCSSSAASQIQWWVPTVLFFSWDFFWRSGLLENWIRSYVPGHFFGCSLRPGTLLNSPASWLHLSFRGHSPYRFRRDNRGCPGLMLAHLQCLFTDGNKPSVCQYFKMLLYSRLF